MKNTFVMKLVSALAVMSILLCAAIVPALAKSSTVSASGTVVNINEETLTSDYGGTVDEVLVSAGDHVKQGDPLLTFATTGVYAPHDGTAYFLGEVGDSAEDVAARYGATAYVEPAVVYTISASTRNAYNNEANRIIHPGESVYLRSTNSKYTGEGRVTKVEGSSFTVEVTSGNFESGKAVNIYRSADYNNESRIGKGSTALQSYTALSGEGIIVNINVRQGAPVKKGDLLFETLSGSYTGATGDLKTVCADKSGVINAVSVTAGTALTAGGAVCTIYPDDGMRVRAAITESDLKLVSVGDPVRVEFSYFDKGNFAVDGTVESISAVSTEDTASSDKEGEYNMTVRLADNTGILYGMTAVVTTDLENKADKSAKAAESADKEEPSDSNPDNPKENPASKSDSD